MSRTSYRTVAASATAEVEVRRSRFIGHVERVGDEQAARACVERVRRQHREARHHCSAFVLGPDAALQRSSDDGEPSGTAGAPILEVLHGRDLSDVALVVTRYFGGVLLGAGGLVRAYSDAARAVLDAAGVRERRLVQGYDVEVGHAGAGRLESDLRGRGVRVTGADHGARVVLHVAVPFGEAAALPELVAALSGGTAEVRTGEPAWTG
jgi:uncharacterized YigZ family protein